MNNPFIQRQMELRQRMISGFSGILVSSDEVQKAEPVFEENLFEKAECYMDDIEKAHQVGETKEINGKTYAWTEYKPGKFDWQIADKKKGTGEGDGKSQSQPKSLADHAKGTSTETLKKVAGSNAPKQLVDAAKKELESRGEGENGNGEKGSEKAGKPMPKGAQPIPDHLKKNYPAPEKKVTDGEGMGDTSHIEGLLKEATDEKLNNIVNSDTAPKQLKELVKKELASRSEKTEKQPEKSEKNETDKPKDLRSDFKSKVEQFIQSEKDSGVKYPSFFISRDHPDNNLVLALYGSKKDVMKDIKKFNKMTGSDISIDSFERESFHGEVSWHAELNARDGKLYKSSRDVDEANKGYDEEEKKNKPAAKKNTATAKTDISTAKGMAQALNNYKGDVSYFSYMYGEDEGVDPDVAKVFDLIMSGGDDKTEVQTETWDYKDETKAQVWKNKMELKGYHVVDLSPDSDTYSFAAFKDKQGKKKK